MGNTQCTKGLLMKKKSPTINLLRRAKPLINLNDLFEYNVNTNVTTKEKGTMLIHPSNFEQFG